MAGWKSWSCNTVHLPLTLAEDLAGVGKAAVTGTNVGVGAGAELAALDVAALAVLLEATLLDATLPDAALLGAALLAADGAALVVAAAAELLGAAELEAALAADGALLAAVCADDVEPVDACPPQAARSGTAAASTLARRTSRRERQLPEITIPPLCRSDFYESRYAQSWSGVPAIMSDKVQTRSLSRLYGR